MDLAGRGRLPVDVVLAGAFRQDGDPQRIGEERKRGANPSFKNVFSPIITAVADTSVPLVYHPQITLLTPGWPRWRRGGRTLPRTTTTNAFCISSRDFPPPPPRGRSRPVSCAIRLMRGSTTAKGPASADWTPVGRLAITTNSLFSLPSLSLISSAAAGRGGFFSVLTD